MGGLRTERHRNGQGCEEQIGSRSNSAKNDHTYLDPDGTRPPRYGRCGGLLEPHGTRESAPDLRAWPQSPLNSPLSFFSKCSYLLWLRLERTFVFVMLSLLVFRFFALLFLLPALPSCSTPLRHARASFHVAIAPRGFKTTLSGTGAQAIGNVTTFDATQAVSPHPPPRAVVLRPCKN